MQEAVVINVICKNTNEIVLNEKVFLKNQNSIEDKQEKIESVTLRTSVQSADSKNQMSYNCMGNEFKIPN